MRTTITLDEELYESAVKAADPGMDKADFIREAMKVFVWVQAAKRLAALGGGAAAMKDIPRRGPTIDRQSVASITARDRPGPVPSADRHRPFLRNPACTSYADSRRYQETPAGRDCYVR
jgi:hypothetical protein